MSDPCDICVYGPDCSLIPPCNPADCYGPVRPCAWCGRLVNPAPSGHVLCRACQTFARDAESARRTDDRRGVTVTTALAQAMLVDKILAAKRALAEKTFWEVFNHD